jgi:hypothetical protein
MSHLCAACRSFGWRRAALAPPPLLFDGANDVADPRLVTCGTSPVLAKESGHFVLLDGDDTLLVV